MLLVFCEEANALIICLDQHIFIHFIITLNKSLYNKCVCMYSFRIFSILINSIFSSPLLFLYLVSTYPIYTQFCRLLFYITFFANDSKYEPSFTFEKSTPFIFHNLFLSSYFLARLLGKLGRHLYTIR